MCWCAVKKLLTHSLFRGLVCNYSSKARRSGLKWPLWGDNGTAQTRSQLECPITFAFALGGSEAATLEPPANDTVDVRVVRVTLQSVNQSVDLTGWYLLIRDEQCRVTVKSGIILKSAWLMYLVQDVQYATHRCRAEARLRSTPPICVSVICVSIYDPPTVTSGESFSTRNKEMPARKCSCPATNTVSISIT